MAFLMGLAFDEDEIPTAVVDYYNNLFTSSSPSDLDMDAALNSVKQVVTEEMNLALVRQCSKEEV